MTKNSAYLENLAKEGSVDPEFLYNYAYLKTLKEKDIADKYFALLTKNNGYDLSNPKVWKYFTLFIRTEQIHWQ